MQKKKLEARFGIRQPVTQKNRKTELFEVILNETNDGMPTFTFITEGKSITFGVPSWTKAYYWQSFIDQLQEKEWQATHHKDWAHEFLKRTGQRSTGLERMTDEEAIVKAIREMGEELWGEEWDSGK